MICMYDVKTASFSWGSTISQQPQTISPLRSVATMIAARLGSVGWTIGSGIWSMKNWGCQLVLDDGYDGYVYPLVSSNLAIENPL